MKLGCAWLDVFVVERSRFMDVLKEGDSSVPGDIAGMCLKAE